LNCSSSECIWHVNSTTSIEILNTKKGDQFDPEYPGHFDPGMGGHFKSESGGQFQRNLQIEHAFEVVKVHSLTTYQELTDFDPQKLDFNDFHLLATAKEYNAILVTNDKDFYDEDIILGTYNGNMIQRYKWILSCQHKLKGSKKKVTLFKMTGCGISGCPPAKYSGIAAKHMAAYKARSAINISSPLHSPAA